MVNGAILARTTRFFVSEFVSHIIPSFENTGITIVCEKQTYTSFILSETEIVCLEFMFPCFHVSIKFLHNMFVPALFT